MYLTSDVVALRIVSVGNVVVHPLGSRGFLGRGCLVKGVVGLVLLAGVVSFDLVSGLDVVVAFGFLLQKHLESREYSHEDDEDEDDDEEVNGEDVLRFDNSGDGDAEDDQAKNLIVKKTKFTLSRSKLQMNL